MPLLRRLHAHHRGFRARLTAALPSINTERHYPDRYLMTAITALPPPSTDFFYCQSLVGRDAAQQFAPVRHQTRLLIDGFALYLDYAAPLQTIMMRAIDRIRARCSCPSTQSALLKSP
jgi:hypothetical protein